MIAPFVLFRVRGRHRTKEIRRRIEEIAEVAGAPSPNWAERIPREVKLSRAG